MILTQILHGQSIKAINAEKIVYGGGNMRLVFIFFLLFVMLFLCGCTTFTQHGQAYKKAEFCYNAGDFDGAVTNSIDSLSIKPTYQKASLLIKKATPQAYEKHEKIARGLEDQAEWDNAITEYDTLLRMSKRLSELGTTYSTIDTQGIMQKRENAIQKAAKAHYSKGIRLMDSKSYNEAAKEFKRAQDFIHDYEDSESLYASCKELAVRKIAIMIFENTSGKSQFGDIDVKLTDQIIDTAINSNPELLVFITRDQMGRLIQEKDVSDINKIKSNPVEMGKLLDSHAFVFGKIASIAVKHTPKTSNTYSREVIIQRPETEGGSYKVACKCTAYNKKCDVIVSTKYEILSAISGTVIKTGTLKTNSSDEVLWAEYKGDERALNEQDQDLCSEKERELEPEEILVGRSIDDLSDKLTDEFIAFFEDFFK